MTQSNPPRRFLPLITRSLLGVAVASVGVNVAMPGVALAQAAQVEADPARVEVRRLLAERLVQTAEAWANQLPDASNLRQSALLMEIARELAADEVRFARSQASLALRSGDVDTALRALGDVRRLDPGDEIAQVQAVDLFAGRMETAEEKLAYLQRIVGSERVPENVRSHAAGLAHDLLLEVGRDGEAETMLARALELNDANLTALRARVQLAVLNGDRAARVRALADLLAAAPSEPASLVSMAQELAAVGLFDDAAVLYNIGLASVASRGVTPPREDMIDQFATMILAGGSDEAASYLESQFRAGQLSDPDLYQLRALAMSNVGEAPDSLKADTILQARAAYVGQIALVSRDLRGQTSEAAPATMPTDPLPDVVADATAIAGGTRPELGPVYAGAIVALLEFEEAFDDRATPIANFAQLTEALRLLVGDADPVYARFEGLRLSRAGAVDDADAKLRAAAATSRFAEAEHLLATRGAGPGAAIPELQGLFDQNPTGLDAVRFARVFAGNGVKPRELPEAADLKPIAEKTVERVDTFFREPRSTYLVRARPIKFSYDLDEPMLAELTITNVSRSPLTLGPGAMLDPVVSVDAVVRGMSESIPMAATSPLAGKLRLKHRESLRQIIRIDGPRLGAVFAQVPSRALAIQATVVTNPATLGRETNPGIGGSRSQIGSVIERRGANLESPESRAKFLDLLTTGTPVERMRVVSLLAPMVPSMLGSEREELRGLGTEIQAAVTNQATAETEPGVRAMMRAAVIGMTTQEPAAIVERVGDLLSLDTELDQALLATFIRALPTEERVRLARELEARATTDRIRALAAALAEMPALPTPTTQPAEEPTTP